MRRLLSAGLAIIASGVALSSAGAADLSRPVRPAPVPVVLPYNWTGFYVGGHIGGGWQDGDSTLLGAPAPLFFPLGTTQSGSGSGFLGGVQAGYNYQLSPNWLVGIEGDISWTNTNFSVTSPSTLIPGSSVRRGACITAVRVVSANAVVTTRRLATTTLIAESPCR